VRPSQLRALSTEFKAPSSRTGITQKLWEQRQKELSAQPSGSDAPDHIFAKPVADSQAVIELNFRDDPMLREQYVSIYGGVRHGKIFEDLDALACNVCLHSIVDSAEHTSTPL